MSVVTNVVLKTSSWDTPLIEQLNAAFHVGEKFVSCDDEKLPRGWYAGDKMLECGLFPGAYNYLDLGGLVRAIREVKWDYPNAVQLFVREQEDDRLREVDLGFQAKTGSSSKPE